jgi:hypothetical protein
VVVGAGVGAADYHYRVAGGCGGGRVIDTVVIHGGLEEVGVGLEPALLLLVHLVGRAGEG